MTGIDRLIPTAERELDQAGKAFGRVNDLDAVSREML